MKKFNVQLLSMYFFIILCAPVMIGSCQTIGSSPYNGSYRINIGEKTRYDYTSVLINNNHYLGSYGQLSNGTNVPINITKGDYFTIEVARVDNSSSFVTAVYINRVLYVSHYEPFRSNRTQDNIFIQPGFDAYSDALYYYSQSLSYNVSRHGDIIELSQNNVYANNFIFSYYKQYNWKTGWLEAVNQKNSYTNGTIITDLVYQRHSDDMIGLVAKVSTNALEISSILVIIAIPVILGISYKSYSQIAKVSDKYQSFTQYLSEKARYTKKTPKKKTKKEVYSTDKVLETIESILEETGGSK